MWTYYIYVGEATTAIRNWYVMNGLMLNADKSGVLLVGTVHMLHTVACPCVVNIAEDPVECRKTITLIDVPFNRRLSMDRLENSKAS